MSVFHTSTDWCFLLKSQTSVGCGFWGGKPELRFLEEKSSLGQRHAKLRVWQRLLQLQGDLCVEGVFLLGSFCSCSQQESAVQLLPTCAVADQGLSVWFAVLPEQAVLPSHAVCSPCSAAHSAANRRQRPPAPVPSCPELLLRQPAHSATA